MNSEAIDLAARCLHDARIRNYQIEALPAALQPKTLADGYAIQGRLLKLLGTAPAGWLLGLTNPYMQRNFNVEQPYYARLLAPNVHRSPARFHADALLTRGLECEIAFRMGRALPPRGHAYTVDEVAEAVSAMLPAVEVVNAHFRDWLDLDLPSVLADNGTDGALVCGAELTDWQRIDRANLPVSLQVNGELVAEGRGGNALGDPLVALTWLANALSARGQGLAAGEIINTGTCTALVNAVPGDDVHATFGALGDVRLTFAD
ncbi:MAG: fumarylacetoacetate hydrolase family protein [Thermomicrobiales bacterium]|nr:fumarylacetoacetate hydrolase family protein [Thermomicrobiales bacterium]